MSDRAKIEALWFESGTAADAARAANMHRPFWRMITARGVERIWQQAEKEGRLPPFVRPLTGFPPGPSSILKVFVKELTRRAA